ncbi:hypothetical protein ZIOFF_046611 [Zingiber officinale]|uniref:Uncharacterized protein n=1 Tax=Zingiber officinale TaxID=94328 RepID=A0A8J5KT21_ZINOF|nr:hypothetical protein ZIOFF_046611 [Zingiber officinale]
MDGKGFESDDSSISSSSNLSDHEVSSSSSTSPLSTSSTSTLGPLFELSATLMAELPVRRGLSKHFQGKSQSFTSLSEARCIEDLAKKEAPTCGVLAEAFCAAVNPLQVRIYEKPVSQAMEIRNRNCMKLAHGLAIEIKAQAFLSRGGLWVFDYVLAACFTSYSRCFEWCFHENLSSP